MTSLRIFIADDQLPPPGISNARFKEQILEKYGDKPENRAFADQCLFMARIVEILRDSGYQVSTANNFSEARKLAEDSNFDLAIIDLGWYMDPTLPGKERPSAGWSLCDKIDEIDSIKGKTTPQILFSSRFPDEPHLSKEAARRQKLPLFKEATDTSRNSLLAAIGFVEATILSKHEKESSSHFAFNHELRNTALDMIRESLSIYRKWVYASFFFIALSCIALGIGIFFIFKQELDVATVLTPISGVIVTVFSALLSKQLTAAEDKLDDVRKTILKEVLNRQSNTMN